MWMHFQPGEGPSRDLLRNCEIFANLRLTFVSSSITHTSSLPSPESTTWRPGTEATRCRGWGGGTPASRRPSATARTTMTTMMTTTTTTIQGMISSPESSRLSKRTRKKTLEMGWKTQAKFWSTVCRKTSSFQKSFSKHYLTLMTLSMRTLNL